MKKRFERPGQPIGTAPTTESSAALLRELIKVVLERQLEFRQRQVARQQVTSHIAASAQWELPQDLLVRQARKALARRVMEMRSSGM